MLIRACKSMLNSVRARTRPVSEPTKRRLFLEPLENRTLLALVVWDGGSLVDSNWMTAANWEDNTLPIPGIDELEFPAIAARKSNTNNFPFGTSFISINLTGNGYTLAGNQVTIGAGGVVDSSPPGVMNELQLSITGSGSLDVTGGGTLRLSNAVPNSFTGGVFVDDGTLELNGAAFNGVIPSGSLSIGDGIGLAGSARVRQLATISVPQINDLTSIVIGSDGAFEIDFGATVLSETVGALAGDGQVLIGAGGSLRVGNNNASTIYSGTISGAGALVKDGTGTMTLSGGTANAHGDTVVTNGVLVLSKSVADGAIPGDLFIGDGIGGSASAAVVKTGLTSQIADSSAVSLLGDGFLQLFFSLPSPLDLERIGSLAGSGSVDINTAGGTLITGDNNTSTTYVGTIFGAGNLTKSGSGDLTLTGNNTYTGLTTVDDGGLFVNGFQPGSDVLVQFGGVLGGQGTTGDITSNSGLITPGTLADSTNVFTASGTVDFNAIADLAIDLGGTTAGVNHDQLFVTGLVDLGGTSDLSINLVGGFVPQVGDQFAIIDYSTIIGTFSGKPDGAIFLGPGGIPFQIFYGGTALFPTAVVLAVVPDISIDDVVVFEGTGVTVNAVFTVTLSGASTTNPVVVNYTTADGTATSPADYTATSGQLVFAVGSTQEMITVPIIGDGVDEPNETFSVVLGPIVQNAVLVDNIGQGTIIDDDAEPQGSVSDVAVVEPDFGQLDAVNAVFQFVLSEASSFVATIEYSTADGTALQNLDYEPTAGTLTFMPGQTVQPVSVRVLGDLFDELDETFVVNFFNPMNIILTDGQAVGTILDDDFPPPTASGDVTVFEGDFGFIDAVDAVFQFSLLGPPSSLVATVEFTTADGNASAGFDYLATSGTLTFIPGGPTTQFVTVRVLGDLIDEFDETFVLNYFNPVNMTLTDAQDVGTIIDNDLPPVVLVSNEARPEGDQGTSIMRFTVSLSLPSGKEITVVLSTTPQTAQPGNDYLEVTRTLTFAPDDTFEFFDVDIVGDVFPEPNESFAVVGFAFNNAQEQLNVLPGTGQIINDDFGPFLVTGADAGGGPHVKVYHRPTNTLIHSFMAYDPRFTGGVRVAVADVNGDAIPDIVTGAGPGGGPHVRVFSGFDLTELLGFMAYNPLFGGGVFVAAADISGDGRADIVTGADAGGGPHVRSFDGANGAQLQGQIGSFFAYKNSMNAGVRVAAGDLDGDGRAEIITGTGAGYENPLDRRGFNLRNERIVQVFSATGPFLFRAFDPFRDEPNYRGGVHLAFGNTGGGGLGQIIVSKANGDGRGDAAFRQAHINGNAGQLAVYDLLNNPQGFPFPAVVRNLNANPYPGFGGSVRIAVVDAVFGGNTELITGAGPGGGPHVRTFRTAPLPDGNLALTALDSFFAYDPMFGGGVWVAG